MAVRMTEMALWDMSSVDQINFIPEYRKCRGLENLGINLNSLSGMLLSEGFICAAGSYSKAPSRKLLVEVLVILWAVGEGFQQDHSF